MRTLRPISITALVLIALSCVAAHFATANMHDPTSSSNLLFTLQWAFSSLGVIAAAVTIGVRLNSREYRHKPLVSTLLIAFASEFIVGGIALILVGSSASQITHPNGTDSTDVMRMSCIWVPALIGFSFGFLGICAVNARNDWGNPNAAYRRRSRRYRVSR